MITKHNLEPKNQKQENINLISKSIKQELQWTEADFNLLLNKVETDYGITKDELITIFLQADFIFIDKPITKLEKVFSKVFIQNNELELIKSYITGQDHQRQWHKSKYKEQLDQDTQDILEHLNKKYTELKWQLEAEHYRVEEELKTEHKAILDRLTINQPTYYKNDLHFITYWQELNNKAKIV